MEGLSKKVIEQSKGFFESPIAHKESFVINGAKVDTIDVKPEKQKIEVPVLVAPGWGATMKSFEPAIKVLADKERRVISLDHPRKGGTVPDSHNPEIEEWYKDRGQKYPNWPGEELRKAHTILGLLEQKKLDKVDVIAHSEAAINVCIAAMLQPEKFAGRTIILYSPAGLIGKDSFLRLKKGGDANTSRTETIKDIPVTDIEKKYLESTKNITPEYIKANPLRAIKEVWAISQTRIEDMLRYLREKGIRIIVVAAVDDTMFPMGKISSIEKKEGGGEKINYVDNRGMQAHVKTDFVDGFLSVKGGHMQIQVHPEMFMGGIETMLPESEEKAKEKP